MPLYNEQYDPYSSNNNNTRLVLDDDADLRTYIVTIDKQSGLDIFLQQDERLCVIKFYAPFVMHVRSFAVSFVNLHLIEVIDLIQQKML